MSLLRASLGLALPALLASLAACSSMQGPTPAAYNDEPPLPMPQPAPHPNTGGGVFTTQDASWSLVSDSRTFRAGDVLTVVLQESTQASKSADTSIAKDSTAAIQPFVIAGHTLKTDIGADAKRDFKGTASSSQQNTLQGAITVIVREVMPNGLLRIQGDKSVFLNQGEEMVRVAGYVRTTDIDTQNRVSSQRIANARIAYHGTGAMADANTPGWLTRLFASPLMPF
jgi:flagellar L-ring protein precursor FlgH